MEPYPGRGVAALVVLNLVLQLFDGVATYVGLHVGFGEGNPLLDHAFTLLGPGSALLLFKLNACACLLLIWYLRQSRLAVPALVLCAAFYIACSVAPWTAALATAHIELYVAS
jgi:Domain of unknown function (DUF5658)